eukprot:2827813-Lingulodinium_polyedra.AAC.1
MPGSTVPCQIFTFWTEFFASASERFFRASLYNSQDKSALFKTSFANFCASCADIASTCATPEVCTRKVAMKLGSWPKMTESRNAPYKKDFPIIAV